VKGKVLNILMSDNQTVLIIPLIIEDRRGNKFFLFSVREVRTLAIFHTKKKQEKLMNFTHDHRQI